HSRWRAGETMNRGFSMSTPRSSRSTGHQEGAVVGYNPRKPGRPSHCYHTYMLSDLRLVLRVEVHRGDQHNPKHAAAGLWSLLAPLGRERWPSLLRGDAEWGNERVMARAEQQGLPYLSSTREPSAVPIAGVRFGHSTTRRRGGRRPPPRED